MKTTKRITLGKLAVAAVTALVIGQSAIARTPPKDLPYPAEGAQLTAVDIIEQVYFVNHFYVFNKYGIGSKGKESITVIINRTKGDSPKTISVERFLNNEYNDGSIQARDIAFFRHGKLRGTGMLITDYVEEEKSQSYMIWLPALRKIRRFSEPAHDDAWGGAVFTFGDVTLRKPHHETHELLGKEAFNDCLGYLDLPATQRNRLTKNMATTGSCRHNGKEVYKVKSTTKFENWWYDYRISYVDTNTFADYRVEYFKDGKYIKKIDKDWGEVGEQYKDPRAVYWKYWYAIDEVTGRETWAVVPDDVVQINPDLPESFWSPRTLTKLKR